MASQNSGIVTRYVEDSDPHSFWSALPSPLILFDRAFQSTLELLCSNAFGHRSSKVYKQCIFKPHRAATWTEQKFSCINSSRRLQTAQTVTYLSLMGCQNTEVSCSLSDFETNCKCERKWHVWQSESSYRERETLVHFPTRCKLHLNAKCKCNPDESYPHTVRIWNACWCQV